MWLPIIAQEGTSHDDLLGSYVQHIGTWSSQWTKGDSELEVMGFGAIPSDTQRTTWRLLQPNLDELLKIALDSLPAPPSHHWPVCLFRKHVRIDHLHPILELCDDGSHVIQFRSDLVIDGYRFNAMIEMKGIRVLLAEWSC